MYVTLLSSFIFQYENYPNSSDATDNQHTVISVEPVTYTYLDPQSVVNGCKENAMVNDYEQPQRNKSAHGSNCYETDKTPDQLNDKNTFAHIPNHYETDSTQLKNSDIEPLYKDPGQKKKAIYEWVDRNSIFKCDKKTVK